MLSKLVPSGREIIELQEDALPPKVCAIQFWPFLALNFTQSDVNNNCERWIMRLGSKILMWAEIFRQEPAQKKRKRGRPKQEFKANSQVEALVSMPAMQLSTSQSRPIITPYERSQKVEHALNELKRQLPSMWNIDATAAKYGLARQTLRDHATKLKASLPTQTAYTYERRTGRKRFIPKKVEELLVEYICNMADIGFALTCEDIRVVVKKLARECGASSLKVSNGWMARFMKRNPGLVTKVCQPFEVLRGAGMNRDKVTEYFNILQKAWAMHGSFKSHRVFNCDEIGFDRDLKNRWGIVPRRLRCPRRVVPTSSLHITMVNLICANGVAHAPFYILPAAKRPPASEGKTKDGRLLGVRESSDWDVNPSGFLTMEIWEDKVVPFFVNQIQPDPTCEEWALLVLDGVGAHVMSPKALKTLWEHKIYVVKMAPHTSADLQPLDRSVYHPVKAKARSLLTRYILETPGAGARALNQWELPSIIEQAWYERASVSNIKAGFRACGLFPLNCLWPVENSSKFLTAFAFTNANRRPIFARTLGVDNLGLDDASLDAIMRFCDGATLDALANTSRTLASHVADVSHENSKNPEYEEIKQMQQCKIDKALEMTAFASLPEVTLRICSDAELLMQIGALIASRLEIPTQQAELVVEWSLQTAAAIAGTMAMPIELKRRGEAHKRTLEDISARSGCAANTPERVAQLEEQAAKRTRVAVEKETKQSDKAARFMREQPLAKALFSASIITWNPSDIQAINKRRIVTKADLQKYIRLKALSSAFVAVTKVSVSAASRDDIASFLLERHLHVEGAPMSPESDDIEVTVQAENGYAVQGEPGVDTDDSASLTEADIPNDDDLRPDAKESRTSFQGQDTESEPEDSERLGGVQSEQGNDTEEGADWNQFGARIRADFGLTLRPDPPEVLDASLVDHPICFLWDTGWAFGTIVNYQPPPLSGRRKKTHFNYDVQYEGEIDVHLHELTRQNYCYGTEVPVGSWALLINVVQ